MKMIAVFVFPIVVLIACTFLSQKSEHPNAKPVKLYWFVPDGLRADPDVFNVFRWAQEGKLPNIKRMMEQGAYGYSIPVFPSHTPVNFAALFTGVEPKRNGVVDGPMRTRGYPLNVVTRSGFSSLAKTIDPFWSTMEKAGLNVSLLSVPGSTPPDSTRSQVIRGRWGGWGVEFPNIIFHSASDDSFRRQMGVNSKVFQMGSSLTAFVKAESPRGWQVPLPKSYSPPREMNLRNWDADLFALLIDSTDDNKTYYDTVYFSLDKKAYVAHLREGEWSEWFPIMLTHSPTLRFKTLSRLNVIKLGATDFFRIRLLYDALNESIVTPPSMDAWLRNAAGPMVDFVDNFPPQLIYFPEDKATFMKESEMSFDWHQRAQAYLLENGKQDILIQSIYSPNQMLTSRWWMGSLDPKSIHYHEISEKDRQGHWQEVLAMYQRIDAMLGRALDERAPDSYVVLSSDHGAAPLNYEVKLNNLFARKGWLKFKMVNGVPQIDWPKTKVVFINMNHVYIHPDGLGGKYQPASGPRYEKLRQQVSDELRALKDSSGIAPLSGMYKREEAGAWGLSEERIGDLVIANKSGYGWIEDITENLEVFVTSLKTGYKQNILPSEESALWTPFAIVGPQIKSGHQIKRPLSHLDQYPTIMRALKIQPPYKTDGHVIEEIFD